MSYTLVVYSSFDSLPSFLVLDDEADKERIAKLKQCHGKIVNDDDLTDDDIQNILDVCADSQHGRLPIPTGTYTGVINVGWS